MPIYTVEGYRMVSPNFSYEEEYWSALSLHVIENYGEDEIKDSSLVQLILKECFQILEGKFIELINNQNLASFYLYVHNFHENSIELYRRQLEGQTLDLDTSEFAITRRVLKIILEQSCSIDLIGTPNFGREMRDNYDDYLSYLERLLLIGYWAIGISDYIAKSQLFPNSIGIEIKDNSLCILAYEPYNYLFNFFIKDLSIHDEQVVLNNTLVELKQIFLNELDISYDVLASIISDNVNDPANRFGMIQSESLIDYIVEHEGYNREYIVDFYAGLTLSFENTLPFEDCILRNQDINRIIYRPILKLKIDEQYYWMIGRNKWLESFATLSTNALPFGICPDEWMKHDSINKFVKRVSN